MPRGRVMVPYQKKAKLWVGLGGGNASLTADATVLVGQHDFTSPQTILRCLFEYTLSPSSAPVAGDIAEVAVALAKVSTDAAAAGAASMPDPVTEEGFPWLYWANHPLFFITTSANDLNEAASVRHVVDVRTQRKFQSNESLVLVVQYFNTTGNPPVKFQSGGIRVLTTLH